MLPMRIHHIATHWCVDPFPRFFLVPKAERGGPWKLVHMWEDDVVQHVRRELQIFPGIIQIRLDDALRVLAE